MERKRPSPMVPGGAVVGVVMLWSIGDAVVEPVTLSCRSRRRFR